MAGVVLNAYKGSASLTQSFNNASPISLPSLENLAGGQIQSVVGNESSNIGGLVGNNAGGTINMLDGGAIGQSFDFANKALIEVFDLTSKSLESQKVNTAEFLNQVASNSKDALTYVDKITDQAGANNNLLKAVLAGVAGIGALFIVLKFSKWGK